MNRAQPSISLVLADDHVVVRRGLRKFLAGVPDFDVIGEEGDAAVALAAARRGNADVLLLDLNMPGHPLDVLSEAAGSTPDLAVLILTMEQDPAFARKALEAGAKGYLLKQAAGDELVEAIREVAAGREFVNRDLARAIAEPASGDEPESELSSREREVLHLISRGHTNTDIARELSLSVRTIETHRTRIQQKLGLSSRPELIRYAIEHDLMT